MKTFAAFGTTFLFLLLTVSVPRLIAQEHENDRNGAKSEQQQDENRQQTTRPQSEPQRDENKHQTATPQEDRRREPSTQEPRANRPDQDRSDQERARQPQTERNESRPAEAQRGKRIPDNRFRASFGRPHTFRLRRDEVINNPRPVITYGGYSFELLEPWPAEWSFDDDCYIDYVDDQYYLFNPVHPGMRIALIVVNID